MTYHMNEPTVCAVYPTFVFICWEPPREEEPLTSAENVPPWSYCLMWSTGHSAGKKCYSGKTAFCHAVIKVLCSNEVICIRIVACRSVSGEVVAMASSECKINANVTVPMPWLETSSMGCRCIFDALFFAQNGVQCVDAIPDACSDLKATILSVRMLELGFASIILKAVYDVAPLPIPFPTVYYFVVCPSALVKTRERLRYSAIQELLENDGACALFCGIGEAGSSAALAAHLFISFIPEASGNLRSRVFCIAYGSPRRMFFEDSLTLTSSLAFSGNFLYYSGSLVITNYFCKTSSSMYLTQETKEPLTNGDALLFNAPLGVQCGPILDLELGCYCLRTQCSGLGAPCEEEYHEDFDVSRHLCILSQLLLQTGEKALLPVINMIEHIVEDGVVVCLSIHGSNLQYRPQLCASSRGDWPATVSVISASPRTLTATFSLLEIISVESSVRRRPLRDIQVSFTLLTDIGYTMYENYSIEISEDIARLLFFETRDKKPFWWIFLQPMSLLDNGILLESFLVTPSTKESREAEIVLQVSTGLIEALATTGEVVSSHVAKKQSVSFLGFVANVAAKVSSTGMPLQAITPMVLHPPAMREATLFESTLKEYVYSKKRSVSHLLSRLLAWRERLQQGLPWLSEENYGNKLRHLLAVFGGTPPAAGGSFVVLELSLLTYLFCYLRNVRGLKNLHYLISLHQCMSFEMFYRHLHPLFFAFAPAVENAGTLILMDIAALWTACLVFHLRCSYLFTHIIAITGCPGSGCRTIYNAIAQLSTENDYSFRGSQRVRNVVIRRTMENELDDLKEVLHLGVNATVVLVCELVDVGGLGYKATWSSLRRALRHRTRQRLFTFLSKADELVGLCECEVARWTQEGEGGRVAGVSDERADDFVHVLRDTAVKTALANIAPAKTITAAKESQPMRLAAVSFAPSLSFLSTSHFVRQSGMSAEKFVERLLNASFSEVRNVLSSVCRQENPQ